MPQRRARTPSSNRPKALLLTGPLAAAGVIAGGWGGWHLRDHPAAGSPSSTVADGVVGGRPADRLTPETITVRVRLSAALQTEVHQQAFSVTLPQSASVSTLLNRLTDAYPVLAAMGPSIMIAVSGQMEPPDRALATGEVVDLVAPTAGG